jgi:hypothetical protein
MVTVSFVGCMNLSFELYFAQMILLLPVVSLKLLFKCQPQIPMWVLVCLLHLFHSHTSLHSKEAVSMRIPLVGALPSHFHLLSHIPKVTGLWGSVPTIGFASESDVLHL